MSRFVDLRGRQPYISNDTTRQWVESIGRKEGLVDPQIVLRVATDSNHIMDESRSLYLSTHPLPNARTQAVLNNCLPGQKIPGLLNWSVTESLNQTTQQATFDCLNCLPLSNITTTVSNVNPTGGPNQGIDNSRPYSDTIIGTWAQDSLFAVERVTGPGGHNSNGDMNVSYVQDSFGYWFREDNVKYRLFANQTFQVNTASKFPNPAIPDDDDNDVKYDTSWSRDVHGAGSYFILVGQEVMRVCQLDFNTSTFYVPPGGRGINGVYQTHSVGENVTLLGHGEPTGEYCAMGYLAVDDFHPETAILRPGTCLVSYEGYGDIVGPLTHDFNAGRNYTFTGYWFVDTVEPSLGEDGIPRATITIRSSGNMYDAQKIDLDTIQRMKNQFGQWTINGRTLFSAAGATRHIPGDWVDYNSWDPTDQYSYPLQIMIEYAQHYAFFQHMQDTQNGLTCILCHQELADYLKTHAAENPRDRPVGRHVYKESIRVLKEPAGPIKTYIRLMSTFAAAAWDHPAYGTELSQKFSKIPNQLFDNIRNIFTGKCYNGQLDFTLASADLPFDYTAPDYDDRIIISRKKDLTCPFQTSYDNAPFSQPMLDLANVNGATFWVDREGYPCFKPYGWNMRSEAPGCRNLTAGSQPDTSGPKFPDDPQHIPGHNGEWMMSYGSSISSYSVNVSKDQVVTQMWVTCSTAFGLDNQSNSFTVTAGGSGYNEHGEMIFYSPLGGHKIGLMLTSGVQQVETMTLDNQYLGMDWNTNPASWGLVEDLQGVDVVLNAKPSLYNGFITLRTASVRTLQQPNAVKKVEQLINFMLVRGYLNPITEGPVTFFQLDIDGKYSQQVADGMVQLHSVFVGQGFGSIAGTTFTYKGHHNPTDAYGRASYLAANDYLDVNAYFIKTDIWWYVYTGRTWDEYVAAITGLPIPFVQGQAPKPQGSINSLQDLQTSLYVIDDKGLQEEQVQWFKNFAQSVANVGNRAVNQTIDQSITRSIQCNLADPRVLPGDTIFCEIPGHLSMTNENGETKPPFNNGIYVTDLTRTMDLESGTYTATYSGTRSQGLFGAGLTEVINPNRDFILS